MNTPNIIVFLTINRKMAKLFGLPIIAAIIAGILFPYTALSLLPFGFVFLFVLMLLSGFSIDWHRLPGMMNRPVQLLLGLFLVFIFFPFMQLMLARFLIADSQFLVGIVFASLMPVALVAPFFTRQLGGDEELAFLLMVLSMLLAPLVAPFLLKQLTATVLPIQMVPFMRNMLLLVTVPLLFSYLISKYLPKIRAAVVPYLAVGNMVTLGVLIFILFGTVVGRLNIGYESNAEIGKLLVLAFFQDFGVFFLARIFVGRIFTVREANAVMVCLSMKNVAIAAGILLFYDPRAALAPALVFVAHACFFSFLPCLKPYLVIKMRAADGTLQD